MIADRIVHLDEKFLKKRFAAEFFGYSGVSKIGNIIACYCPVSIRVGDSFTVAEQGINFVMELPGFDDLSAIMFKRLMLLSIGQILNSELGLPITQSLDDIIIKKEHTSGGIVQNDGIVNIGKVSSCGGAKLVYIGLYNKAGEGAIPRAYSLGLDSEKLKKIMTEVIASFYSLSHDMFYRTNEIIY